MKKFFLMTLCAVCACSLLAQQKVMRIHLANGKSEVRKVNDIVKVTFEEMEESEWPEDPNPPMNGYIKSVFTDGELMYYGKDPEYSSKDGAIYFLYLKDLNNKERSTSVSFYVNVPRQKGGQFELPEGTYTTSNTWDIGTFNNKETAKYKSNWNVVDPKWVQYVVEDGVFIVEKIDAVTYSVKGRVKGGSIQDDGSIAPNEYGIEFEYTGKLPVEDYSSYYEDPEDPEDPENPEIPDAEVLTTGDLYYYGDNEYYLNLKDKRPMDTNEITLYLYSTPEGGFELQSGEYKASAEHVDWTFASDNSSWTYIDHDMYDDRVRCKLDQGSVKITSKGNHEYEISGTVKSSENGRSFSFTYSGTIPFEDYSY